MDSSLAEGSSTELCVLQPNLSASWLFQRAMSARSDANVSPNFINELLYVNFLCMQVESWWLSFINIFLSSSSFQLGMLMFFVNFLLNDLPEAWESCSSPISPGLIVSLAAHTIYNDVIVIFVLRPPCEIRCFFQLLYWIWRLRSY